MKARRQSSAARQILAAALGWAALLGPARGAGLFDRTEMKRVALAGMNVRLGKPVQVTAQISWETRWPGEDGAIKTGYFHFFPQLAKFPGGNLIAAYSVVPDANDDPVQLSAYQISTDGGAHWSRRYAVLTQQPAIYVPQPPNSLLALPYNLTELTPGDGRNFVGPSYFFEKGGSQMRMLPEGMRVADWPWTLPARYSSQPRENWNAGLSFGGGLLRRDRALLVTSTMGIPGRKRSYQTVLLRSVDEGGTWRYFSTIAGPDAALAGQQGYEGPNECGLVELAGGDLMAVLRVGSGRAWPLRQSYSHDGGRTWSPPEVIAPFSVYPRLVRLANGVIALSTGRPGVDLWLSTDGRGRQWQKIDIAAYNNECAPDATYRIDFFGSGPTEKSQTDSYTTLVEVAPNRLLLAYDRDPVIRPPDKPPASPQDLSRLFILPIEIELTPAQ